MTNTRKRKYDIPYVRIGFQAEREYSEIEPIIREVLFSGSYIGGTYVEKLEASLADFIGVGDVVTLNSGTDALMFALLTAGVQRGDEVITAPNSFIASASSIVHIGATPIFADVNDDQNISPKEIQKKISKKTKAILPVHLTGRPCLMDEILNIAEEHNLMVVEDAAQSIGTLYKGKKTGSLGHFGCFSTHPLKNLNALGDGGFISTNDLDAAEKIRTLRSHGLVDRGRSDEWGLVSRMDALQAAVLLYRLQSIDEVTKRRRENAEIYKKILNRNHVFFPFDDDEIESSYHTFVIQCERRDELRQFLAEIGIKTSIHYPVPIHLQQAANKLNYSQGDFPVAESQALKILTLPVNQHMKKSEIESVAKEVNYFFDNM